jgi:hypothetical protein
MSSSSITPEQLSIACWKVDGASPTAQPRVASVDAFQLRVYFSVLTDEVASLESGLDEASDPVDNDNFITTTSLEMLRRQRDSTDTTTRRKRELLLDNADRLTSMMHLHYAITESRNPSRLSRLANSSTKPCVSLKLFARLSSRIGAKFQ